MLAQQGTQPLELTAELPAFVSQRWQAGMFGCPGFLPGSLAGQQFPFPLTQHFGLLMLLSISGSLPLAAGGLDLLVQVAAVRPGLLREATDDASTIGASGQSQNHA